MLIIKLVEDINDTRKFFLRLLLGKNDSVRRECFVIRDKQFDMVYVPDNELFSPEMKKLLLMNRGKVLETLDVELNGLLSDYLFDKKPYYKRTLLSSVTKYVINTRQQLSVVVHDNSFVPCGEYSSLTEQVKALTIVTPVNPGVSMFVEQSYYEYGLRITVRDSAIISDYDLSVDFSEMSKDGSLRIFYKGEGISVYPDRAYFEPDEAVLKLVENGVPIKCACAALGDDLKGNNYMI